MSSKVAHYLQEHLVGEVISNTDARLHFATDGSILQVAPALVVYPKNENDVRKTARFSWQLAERGRIIPITARGNGTDQTGAAIGSGMILAFTAHMNRILELDSKTETVTVEPGINFSKLQQVLHTHGRFLPTYPVSIDYSSVGGAVSNNKSGQKSLKYGSINNYVKGLRVVLANGEVMETSRISKRELGKKLGLATFEGEIYRSVDTLLEEKREVLEGLERGTALNNAGYNLLDIKHKDGSFDLTPLIAGSQGTLGLITEIILSTESYDPKTTLIVAQFDSLEFLQKTLIDLRKLPEVPSAVEMVDQYALDQVYALNPNHLKDSITKPYPSFLLFVEFEGNERGVKKSLRSTYKLLDQYAKRVDTFSDLEEQIQQWKIREAVNVLIANNDGLVHSVPLFDGAVPPDRLREYMEGVYKLMSVHSLKPAMWGNAGDANLMIRPHLNLSQVGDRQKAFRILDEYTKLVLSLNGTISASAGDGRLKAPYIEHMYGTELYSLLFKIKQIFDPYGTLNPGVKFGTNIDDIKTMVRADFSLKHLYDHLPRA
jgi:FAD/FMN-containing dehydrogenase